MSALKYWTFPRVEIERLIAGNPIPKSFLDPWEAARPGVLCDDQQDIFATNSRSHRQARTRYDLFERVTDPAAADFCVLQNWLELCLAGGVREHISPLIDATLQAANGKPCLYSWNHDTPSDDVLELATLIEPNALVLNYNCREPLEHDLTLPFWNITANLPPNDNQNRSYKTNFIGQCSGDLRRRIRYAFQQRPGHYFSEDRRPESEYLSVMRDSWFTLCPRGGGLSSYRTFEAIQNLSIPVLFADDYALPFPDLDWRSFCVRIPERLAGDIGAIETVLDAVDKTAMLSALRCVKHEFDLQGVQERIVKRIRGMLA